MNMCPQIGLYIRRLSRVIKFAPSMLGRFTDYNKNLWVANEDSLI